MRSQEELKISQDFTLFKPASFTHNTNVLTENKSHVGTFITPSKGKIDASYRAISTSETDDFFAADELSGFQNLDTEDKKSLIISTFDTLEKVFKLTNDFSACVTFVSQQKEKEGSHFVSCLTVRFRNTGYKTHLLAKEEDDYIYKSVDTNRSYSTIEVKTTCNSLNQVFQIVTSENDTFSASELTDLFTDKTTSLQFAFKKTQQPHTLYSNSSVLIIPLSDAPENTCLSTAIFTGNKNTSTAYNVSAFFYYVLKEKIKKWALKEKIKEWLRRTPRLLADLDIIKILNIQMVADMDIIKKLNIQKKQLILFKQIYKALYNFQDGLKKINFFDTPESLYLNVNYFNHYVRDEENSHQRRTKAWQLTKKYYQLIDSDDPLEDRQTTEAQRKLLHDEICAYASNNAIPSTGLLLSKAKQYTGSYFSALTSLFWDTPRTQEVKKSNDTLIACPIKNR